MTRKNWIPEPKDIIYVGVPSVGLSPHEFIGITSDGNYLYWSTDGNRADVTSPEFCHKNCRGE